MTKKFNLYLGKAGHFHAMSEFLCRGWNVAIPEVDIGDDIFVVKDETGEFWRVQVKTANGISRKDGWSAQFSISAAQLIQRFQPELIYVFLVRNQEGWSKPLVISRQKLYELFKFTKIGAAQNDKLVFYFSFQNDKVICSEIDLTSHLNNFSDFPLIEH